MNELKVSSSADPEGKAKVSSELLHYLEEYLVRCGIYEPFDKIYVKNATELMNADMGRILAVLLISQLPRLQICYTTGDLITKKAGESIDGYPFIVGVYTVLHQTRTENLSIFIEFLCHYTKMTLSKSKTVETNTESSYIIRILQLFCETFNIPFKKLEDKLPLVLLTHTLQK